MSTSIVTNVASLIARENLRVTNEFQGRTINRLTSGLRINSSGDDAAGLAVANRFRSDITELTQGVRNANDGLSKLQIVDGGLNNISNILDRLKTLATQSGSDTFTGNRATLNNEYAALLKEVNRQAAHIGLVSGGANNTTIAVYVGGGSTQANAKVDIDLSGAANRVDATGLGVGGTQVINGGVKLGTVSLDATGTPFLNNANGAQDLVVNLYDSALGATVTKTVSIKGKADGISGDEVLRQVNEALNSFGITASKASDGALSLSSSRAFSVTASATSGGGAAAITVIAGTSTAVNTANFNYTATDYATSASDQAFTLQNSSGSVNVSLAASDTAAVIISKVNAAAASIGIEAVGVNGTSGFSIQSSSDFSFMLTNNGGTGGLAVNPSSATTGATAAGAVTITSADTSASATGNALAAIAAIDKAITSLGQVQGKVGTAQNKLQYSVQLAQSQISSFSAAESRIRDADIALEASNLTKAQVMQQASIAALAQANTAPQAVLALLRG